MTANCTSWGADPQVSQTCAIAESKEMAMAQHPATSQVTPLQESPLHTSQSLISQDSAGSPVEKERASSHVAEAGICGAVWCGQGGCGAVYGHLVCSVEMINLWNKGWQRVRASVSSPVQLLCREQQVKRQTYVKCMCELFRGPAAEVIRKLQLAT